MDPGRASEDEACFCDKYCEMFKDCCADYAKACINTSRLLNTFQVTECLWKCHHENSSAKSVWMISSCPTANSTPDNIRKSCSNSVQTNLKDIVPVKDPKAITYKNRFCALCHGISANGTEFYDAELLCNDTVIAIKISNITEDAYANCSFLQWKLPEKYPRRYCLRSRGNESCLLQSKFLREKCTYGIPGIVSDVWESDRYYLNQYCALCSNVSLVTCGPGLPLGPGLTGKTPLIVISVPRGEESQPNVVSCGPDKVYDIMSLI